MIAIQATSKEAMDTEVDFIRRKSTPQMIYPLFVTSRNDIFDYSVLKPINTTGMRTISR